MSATPDASNAPPWPASITDDAEAEDQPEIDDPFERTLAGLYPRLDLTAQEKDLLLKSGLG